MEEIRITLETLYDILRNEKKREELQKLEVTFYHDVVNYLKDKIAFLEQRKNDRDIFASGERDKLEYELRSIRRILKEIYEKREKKIIDIAMNKSRTGSDLIDTGSMLPEEKEFYLRILKNFDEFRRGVLFNLFKGEVPNVLSDKPFQRLIVDEKPEQKPALEKTTSEVHKAVSSAPINESVAAAAPVQEVVKTKIKFLQSVPSFVWKDMKVYGPFNPGDETEIFPEVADLFIRKAKAEKII
jgi:DNA replication initiation complex subunit (GINS family)